MHRWPHEKARDRVLAFPPTIGESARSLGADRDPYLRLDARGEVEIIPLSRGDAIKNLARQCMRFSEGSAAADQLAGLLFPEGTRKIVDYTHAEALMAERSHSNLGSTDRRHFGAVVRLLESQTAKLSSVQQSAPNCSPGHCSAFILYPSPFTLFAYCFRRRCGVVFPRSRSEYVS